MCDLKKCKGKCDLEKEICFFNFSKKICDECYDKIERVCKECQNKKNIKCFTGWVCDVCIKKERNKRAKIYQKNNYKKRKKKQEILNLLKIYEELINNSTDIKLKEEIKKINIIC